jgi:hypothetical protein
MFIPRGKAVHENLATSYVLVDALVDDLCEGGFSGIVEVLLRDADSHVLIDRGTVAAVVERRQDTPDSRSARLVPATLADLAARAKSERGRVSIYSFPPGTTGSLASLVDAEPLYTALSTDFADLEKMVAKLRREVDRQWFVEVTTQSGRLALIHVENDHCRVLNSDAAPKPEDAGADETELKELLDECRRVGGAFDVYFKKPGAGPAQAPSPSERERLPWDSSLDPYKPEEPAIDLSEPAPFVSASGDPSTEDAFAATDFEGASSPATRESDEPPFVIEQAPAADSEPAFESEDDKDKYWSSFSAESHLDEPQLSPPEVDASATAIDIEATEIPAISEPPLARRPRQSTADLHAAEAMAEIKRLMGEIAKTIDEASRAAEQRDAFSMYLRAGQLKIADRYPFLDPFGAEFEYMGGEIVFIGKADAEQFKEGLTESIRLAVVGVAQSSAQPARLRAYVTEDLRKLRERLGSELERYGLEETIEQISAF